MEDIHLPFRGKVSDKVLIQEIEGEAVLLNLSNEQYFGLNDVGTRFWNLLSEHGESEKVIEALKEEYMVDEDELENDLAVLVNKLVDQGLFVLDNR